LSAESDMRLKNLPCPPRAPPPKVPENRVPVAVPAPGCIL
jgi:hypothetical protein